LVEELKGEKWIKLGTEQSVDRWLIRSNELMARNCARLLATDVCFSFTGFAPTSDEAQVGLSYASIFINGKVYTNRFYQPAIQDRKAYQQRAIEAILIFFQKNVLN
jgi:nicotinamide mononucleotide (NMN) deamidase PncC